jgi:hypothetical protein
MNFRRLFRPFLTVALALSLMAASTPSERKDWSEYALRLSGESETVHESSVKHLKDFPKLDEALRHALTEKSTRRFLALDVITTLKKETLIPDVMAQAKNDETGFFFLGLNGFFHTAYRKALLDLYAERLQNPSAKPPVKMVILDTFGRMEVKLSVSELTELLLGSNPDVRSAALYYLRAFRLRQIHDYDTLLANLETIDAAQKNKTPFSVQLDSLKNELAQKTEHSR